MSACGAVGSIEVGGRPVAAVRCTLDAGHGIFGTPHEATLEWRDESIAHLPDLALLDPDETFDADVPLAPLPVDVDDALIASCPTPEYHKTHRYCPSCPWVYAG